MATNFSPCKGSYVLNQFPSNVMFGMNGFHVSASGAIQGHHGPLVSMCCCSNLTKYLNWDAATLEGVASHNNRNVGLANQKLCHIQIYEILEKRTKNRVVGE